MEGICLNCGKPTKLIKKGLYHKFCSRSCSLHYRNINDNELRLKYKNHLNKCRNNLIHQKNKETLNKYKLLYKTGKIINYDIKFSCHCNICNKDFYISRANLYNRLIINKINPCPHCHKKKRACGKSKIEYELFDFIKSLDNSVIDHAKIFDNKKLEVDFYIPIKNIAFEFDGTYWHCDPRFYNEDFFNKVKNKTAKEIWEKDAEKDQLCLDKNVILYRVKEYDWLNNQNIIKQEIKNLLGII